MTINFFGEKLKAVRKSKRLTQLELSRRLEVSKGTISAYEQNLSYPSIETLVKLCGILDTSSDYLLGISDDLPFKMGGLIDEQMGSVLQFVSLIEKANEVVDRNNSIV
jgi:Predicted transcriptional regulators